MEEVQPVPEDPVVTGKPGKRKVYERKEKDEEKGGEFQMGEFEKFGENWIPDREGEQIEGFVLPSEDFKGDYGPVPTVIIGEKRVLCGAGLKDLPKLEGKFVRLVYLGKEPSKHKGRKDWMKFDIFVRKEE